MDGASTAATTASVSTSHIRRDLALERVRDLPVRTADDRVGLDTDVAQRRDRVLRRLGLELAGRRQVRHQADVQEEDVVAADVVADLTGRLQERQRLDVADRATDLGDDHVGRDAVAVRLGHRADAPLDLVGDVRDHLDRVAQVLAAPLLGDDLGVHLSGRHVRVAAQVTREEPLVVADVEVRLRTVVGHEDLAVLERVHRAGVHVQVRVQLLHGDPQAARGEQLAEARRGEPLAERGGDASGDEDVLGRTCLLHQRGSREIR